MAMQTDLEVQDAIRRYLAERPDVGHGDLDVQVTEGVVTLTGTMRDEKEKWQIEDAIRSTQGVKDLHNRTMTTTSGEAGSNDSDIARPWFPSS